MDYYKGETLKKKIEQRPLKLNDAINIAVQIAQGLAKAHEAGIVHRDIKPANIIITEDGEVKILDFGLVKLTGFTKLTRPGSTLGTTYYMSPEQMRGEKVDQRTDIWALGVVLYEMITGQLPFKGEYEQAVSYAILHDEPEPITALRSGVPLVLEGVVNKAMAKDPKQRYQHMDEIPVDLSNIKTRSSGTSRITPTAVNVPKKKQQKQWLRAIPWIIAGTMTLAALFSFWRSEPSVQPSVKRTHINLPETAPLDPIGSTPYRAGQPALAISPDGANLVYVANIDGETHLYLRPLNGFEAEPIPGTQGAYAPFFSPNGKWIGFFAENNLKKVNIYGGRPSTLCKASLPRGGSWGLDNRIIFSEHEGSTLSWILADGSPLGTFSIKTRPPWPEILPGAKAILSQGLGGIKIFFPDTEKEDILIKGPYSNPKYIPTGHILCASEGKLVAIRFDLENLNVTGSPVTVIEQVRTEGLGNAGQLAVSSDGTLIYLSGSFQGIGQLFWVNSRGEEEKLDFPAAEYKTFQISPGGERLAITIKGPDGWNVWIYDLISGDQRKLTMDGNNRDPVWTSDGNWVSFESDRNGYSNLYRKRVDGLGDIEQLTKNTNKYISLSVSSWSPDDKILACSEFTDTSSIDILLLERDNKGITKPFVKTKFQEFGPVFSPDGRWIAYASDEQGKYDIYVQSYPQTGKRWQISSENGHEPIWSVKTQEIYYWMYEENVMKWMAVSYTDTPIFNSERPRELFRRDFLDISGRGWDISPSDQRFLLLKGRQDYNKKYTQINVITNWFEELKSKMSQEN
jgi:Tol biopolymer transport system component